MADETPNTASPTPLIVQPGTGRDLPFPRGASSVMLGSEQTGGRLTVIYNTDAPGDGPPPHVHAHEDEMFLVVDGQYSYCVDGRWTEVGPGGVVYLPRGTVHCYRNVGTTPSHQWIITTPAGFERFFARFADELARAGGPDMSRIVSISLEHGITYPDVAPE